MQGQADGSDVEGGKEAHDSASLARRFGEELRKRRESMSLDVASLAQATRINRPFLEALETGEFERLPGQVFGRGFLRSVGKALSFTPEETSEIIAAYDACWAPKPQQTDCLKVQIKNKPYPAPSERVAGFVKRVVPSKGVVTGALAFVLLAGGGFAGMKAWPRVKQKLVAMSVEKETPAPNTNASTNTKVVAADVPVNEPDLATVVPEEPAAAPAATAIDAPAVVPAGAVTVPAAAEAVAAAPKNETPPAPAVDAAPKAEEPKVAAAEPAKPAAADVLASEPSATAPVEVASAPGEQVLELVVTEPVRVRLDMDEGQTQTRELAPQTYRFSFKDQADLLIYDAAALKISFNGRALGPLGNKGRVRRLSFRAAPPNEQNL